MTLTPEDKELVRAQAHADGFSEGIVNGRKVADESDAAIYTRPDMTNLEIAQIYALAYVRAYVQGFVGAFKRECDINARLRYDTRINLERRKKREEKARNG